MPHPWPQARSLAACGHCLWRRTCFPRWWLAHVWWKPRVSAKLMFFLWSCSFVWRPDAGIRVQCPSPRVASVVFTPVSLQCVPWSTSAKWWVSGVKTRFLGLGYTLSVIIWCNLEPGVLQPVTVPWITVGRTSSNIASFVQPTLLSQWSCTFRQKNHSREDLHKALYSRKRCLEASLCHKCQLCSARRTRQCLLCSSSQPPLRPRAHALCFSLASFPTA